MAGKKKPGPSIKDDKVYSELRSEGAAGSYDDWTVDELRKRAKELGLSGYSGKKKSALVAMLRNH
ncbi:MAG TPA: Rho termination factor N-terminal domain-containing protein [Propionibacteriaceae bacterium]|jgi:hypothetical protein|nr:Rho termination factor N-terminal domain-containing protein [Propionibacteriaceae bacterium]